jgi:hypothetical protein
MRSRLQQSLSCLRPATHRDRHLTRLPRAQRKRLAAHDSVRRQAGRRKQRRPKQGATGPVASHGCQSKAGLSSPLLPRPFRTASPRPPTLALAEGPPCEGG